MANLEELVDEMTDEALEAGFRTIGAVAEVQEQLLDEHGEILSPVQADAVRLAAEMLYSLSREVEALP